MNNSTLNSADRTTHLKIVGVALLAGIMVIGIGLAARPALDSGGVANASNRMEASKGPIIKAGKPLAVTSSGNTAIQ